MHVTYSIQNFHIIINVTQCHKKYVYQDDGYRQISNISITKYQHWNVFHLVWQLSLPNLLKPGVK